MTAIGLPLAFAECAGSDYGSICQVAVSCKERSTEMALADFDKTKEMELTTVGRVSGRESSRTVWFVRDGEILYLLPVDGSGSQWYKNLLKTPVIRLAAQGTNETGRATPITEPMRIAEVVDSFRARYGAQNIEAYYPKRDVAVEVQAVAQ
jgi:hypothetical protein